MLDEDALFLPYSFGSAMHDNNDRITVTMHFAQVPLPSTKPFPLHFPQSFGTAALITKTSLHL